ncbi:unnamed protein product [Lathyrus oleraceus]
MVGSSEHGSLLLFAPYKYPHPPPSCLPIINSLQTIPLTLITFFIILQFPLSQHSVLSILTPLLLCFVTSS